jgi:hypothetical protein
MSNLYLKWQRNRFKPYMFHYYDVQHRRFLWINGLSLNQTETVHSEVTVMDFGIDSCYSQRADEIGHKVLKLRGGGVTVMVFTSVGSYFQSIAMIRYQISMCSYS